MWPDAGHESWHKYEGRPMRLRREQVEENILSIAGMLEFQAKLAVERGSKNIELDAQEIVPKIVSSLRELDSDLPMNSELSALLSELRRLVTKEEVWAFVTSEKLKRLVVLVGEMEADAERYRLGAD